MQKVTINNEEVEVYTAAERDADIATAKKEVEDQFTPKLTAAEQEKARLEGLLQVRAGEIKGIRKLSDEQVAKLSAAELVIYENGLELAKAGAKIEEGNKVAHKSAVESTIRSIVGTDDKLFAEALKMYDIVNLEDATPEQIKIRASAAIGALSQTSPDLLAAAGLSSGGGFEPPKEKKSGEQSYADTPEGQAAAERLGLMTKLPEEEK